MEEFGMKLFGRLAACAIEIGLIVMVVGAWSLITRFKEWLHRKDE